MLKMHVDKMGDFKFGACDDMGEVSDRTGELGRPGYLSLRQHRINLRVHMAALLIVQLEHCKSLHRLRQYKTIVTLQN